MNNLELTRENINYELFGLGMQLRYLRDALMCSFMDVPVNYFITLRGNLPAINEERIPFLECMATNVDVEFFKEAKTLIFNTNYGFSLPNFRILPLLRGGGCFSLVPHSYPIRRSNRNYL